MKRTLVNLAKFGVSAAIIGWLVHNARHDDHFAQLVDEPKNWGLLLAAWSLLMAGLVGSIVRWHLLVRALGLPFTLKDAFRLGFLGYLFNFVSIGSVGGDLFKAIFVAREHRGRRPEAVATVVIDRIIGLYGLFIVASAAILVTGQLHSPVQEIQLIGRATLVATAVGAIVILVLLAPGFTNGSLSDLLAGLPRIGPILKKLIGAVRIYRSRPGVLLLTTAISVGVHTLAACGIWLIARGLPGEAPSLSAHLVVAPLALVTGLLPLPMSGLGAFEGALDFLYVKLPGVTVSAGRGLVVALVYRLMTVVMACVGAVYYVASRRELASVLQETQLTAAEPDLAPSGGGRQVAEDADLPVAQV